MNRKLFKEQQLFEIEIFCNITNAFTVTFDQFYASLLNKNSFVTLDHKTSLKCQFFKIEIYIIWKLNK